jgi:hypothetical protein
MVSRRWLQFSLRFLFAGTAAAALVAWWFRPGVVTPEFSFEGINHRTAYTLDFDAQPFTTHEVDAASARIRLTNAGPDTFFVHDLSMGWLPDYKDAERNAEQKGIPSFWMISPLTPPERYKPVRVKPGKFMTLDVPISDDMKAVSVSVSIADRRGRTSPFWSRSFDIVETAVAARSPQ